MKLRKIVISKQETILKKDFELFKPMYTDMSLHWLYKSNDLGNNQNAHEPNYECHPYPDEVESIQAQYDNYSYDNFTKDIKADNIFFIEDNNHIYGYVQVRKNPGYLYIAEWAIKANITERDLKEVLEKIIKLYPKKDLMVPICNEKAKKFFRENGFKEVGTYSVKKAALSN